MSIVLYVLSRRLCALLDMGAGTVLRSIMVCCSVSVVEAETPESESQFTGCNDRRDAEVLWASVLSSAKG